MGLLTLPTATDDSVGIDKVDRAPVPNNEEYIAASEWNEVKNRSVEYGECIGLADGSTSGSLQEQINNAGGGMGAKLFQWDGSTTGQFDIANANLEGAVDTPSLAIVSLEGRDHLRFRVNKNGGGSFHAGIPILNLDLPNRYVAFYRIREAAGTTATYGGWLYMSNGLTTTNHDGFMLLASQAGSGYTPALEAGLDLSTGATTQMSRWSNVGGQDSGGRVIRVQVENDLTLAASNFPTGRILWDLFGSGLGTGIQQWDLTERVSGYADTPALWDPTTLTKAGIAIADFTGATGNMDVLFSDIAIFSHWMDV